MFRKDLLQLLLHRPLSVRDMARELDVPPAVVAEDLRHLLRSLKRSQLRAVVTPARCRKCGFTFDPQKLTKPSRCPLCHSTWVSEPRLSLERPQGTGRVARGQGAGPSGGDGRGV